MAVIEKRRRGRQSVFAKDGTEIYPGEWNPKTIFNTLTQQDPSFWKDKTVLEIAANTGGLSVELARAGARVLLTEPDPYGITLATSEPAISKLIADEGLNIAIQRRDFFSCRDLPKYDVIVCLGLLYHFRHPQLMLDILSSMRPRYLFISTQTHRSSDLALVNRRHPGVLPSGFLDDSITLTGWHPTRPLFERMLQWSGFGEITSLTTEDFPKKKPGLTNSAYYRATLITPVDPDAEIMRYHPR